MTGEYQLHKDLKQPRKRQDPRFFLVKIWHKLTNIIAHRALQVLRSNCNHMIATFANDEDIGNGEVNETRQDMVDKATCCFVRNLSQVLTKYDESNYKLKFVSKLYNNSNC